MSDTNPHSPGCMTTYWWLLLSSSDVTFQTFYVAVHCIETAWINGVASAQL